MEKLIHLNIAIVTEMLVKWEEQEQRYGNDVPTVHIKEIAIEANRQYPTEFDLVYRYDDKETNRLERYKTVGGAQKALKRWAEEYGFKTGQICGKCEGPIPDGQNRANCVDCLNKRYEAREKRHAKLFQGAIFKLDGSKWVESKRPEETRLSVRLKIEDGTNDDGSAKFTYPVDPEFENAITLTVKNYSDLGLHFDIDTWKMHTPVATKRNPEPGAPSIQRDEHIDGYIEFKDRYDYDPTEQTVKETRPLKYVISTSGTQRDMTDARQYARLMTLLMDEMENERWTKEMVKRAKCAEEDRADYRK